MSDERSPRALLWRQHRRLASAEQQPALGATDRRCRSVVVLGKQLYLLEEFLAREHQNKGLRLDLKPLNLPKALVHGHCHQKAFGVMKATRKVLSWIPGFSYEVVETTCCGMAGSFGLDAEHYDASMQMAELALLPAVRASAVDTPLIANGFSCRHQIEHGSGRRARHIAQLLRDALARN